MGSSSSLPKGDKIIWIDENVKNEDNTNTLKLLQSKLKLYKIFAFDSVDAALFFIKSYNRCDFNLIYIIVSGRLTDEFIHKYIPLIYSLKVIISLIIYCGNLIYYQQKYSLVNDYYLKPKLL